MASDDYHEALLDRIHVLQHEIVGLTQREAHDLAFVVSREIPEEAARMLVAEMLLDYWVRTHQNSSSTQ